MLSLAGIENRLFFAPTAGKPIANHQFAAICRKTNHQFAVTGLASLYRGRINPSHACLASLLKQYISLYRLQGGRVFQRPGYRL